MDKNNVGLEIGDEVVFSITEELIYQNVPNILCPAVDRIWDKWKARGFKRITVRKIVK